MIFGCDSPFNWGTIVAVSDGFSRKEVERVKLMHGDVPAAADNFGGTIQRFDTMPA